MSKNQSLTAESIARILRATRPDPSESPDAWRIWCKVTTSIADTLRAPVEYGLFLVAAGHSDPTRVQAVKTIGELAESGVIPQAIGDDRSSAGIAQASLEQQNSVARRAALFIEKLNAYHAEQYAKDHSTLSPPKFSIDPSGKKFWRVRDNRSVYCFIDASNGDLLKAEGWKKPAKGKRGSIFNPNYDVGTVANLYGSGFYLKR